MISASDFLRLLALITLPAGLLLSGCGNDSNPRPGAGHDHAHHGRLILADNNAHAYVYDLDQRALLAPLHLDYPAHSLHTSPGKRFVVITQRATGANPNQIQFIDAGLFVHGDHIDVLEPSVANLTLSGEAPAHYRAVGNQATLFFDGASASQRFVLFTDSSLAAGNIVAAESTPAAHHGIAEPRGEYVLVSTADRERVAVFGLHHDHFHLEETLPEPCPNLHGGASLENHAAFGCDDGVLLVHQDGGAFTASKIITPLRITQLAGHPAMNEFVAFAAGNQAIYAVDPISGTVEEIDWSASTGTAHTRHLIDATGAHLLVLDDAGTVHILTTDDWSHQGSIAVLQNGTGAHMVASASDARAYLLEPAEQIVRVLDITQRTLLDDDQITLDFSPVGLAWAGISGAAAEALSPHRDHDHQHGHQHDHQHSR
ncbi:hypothetical protein [Alcanivorax quisquiliarum]|uniref:Lipoprotein n=1 Tax=Alcanivorax quisquiliarum TaxID=2933565 RepID=A0ABT0E6L3_9GAMM|nr:hypothetical protein [Alcanivorax quisquiliarum]MCK0537446.1 hypothetical protein [Alcanivorax quisquiliarum]